MQKLSVVVMTLNEAENIGRCLDSVQSVADEILVVDSGSTDDTVTIAKSKGASVVHHDFEGMIEQRRFCISRSRYDRVLALDADEWLSVELAIEIRELKTSWPSNTYYLNRLNSFGGQWIRHGAWYPSYRLRLFEKQWVYNTGTNPHEIIAPLDGATSQRLSGHLLHLSDLDIQNRYRTINSYTTVAAHQLLAVGKKPRYWRILVKPPARFISEYFFQLGLLDGFYGFIIAKSSALYVFLREAKLLELYRKAQNGKER